jgi:hypothetical protein
MVFTTTSPAIIPVQPTGTRPNRIVHSPTYPRFIYAVPSLRQGTLPSPHCFLHRLSSRCLHSCGTTDAIKQKHDLGEQGEDFRECSKTPKPGASEFCCSDFQVLRYGIPAIK